jgi:uncharacterized membrane protein
MLNHVPVLGVVFGALVLAAGLRFHNDTLTRLALVTLVVAAFAAIPVYLSGGSSEDRIEKLVGVHESTIEQHEDAARVATIVLGALGLASLVMLIRSRRRSIPRALASALLVAALALSGVLAWTAHLGGQIRHSEIRGGSTLPASAESDEGGAERE